MLPTSARASSSAWAAPSRNLLKLLPATAIDRILTRRRLTVALAMLTVERSARGGRAPPRSDPSGRGSCPAGAIIVDAILERLRRRSPARVRRGHPRGAGARRRHGRPGLARPAAAARPRLEGVARAAPLDLTRRRGARGPRPPARAPAGTRGWTRRATAAPTVRRSRASSRSRSTRYRPIAALCASVRSPACSTRNCRARPAATSASWSQPRWSWSATTFSMTGPASRPSASRTNSSV